MPFPASSCGKPMEPPTGIEPVTVRLQGARCGTLDRRDRAKKRMIATFLPDGSGTLRHTLGHT